ncbi:hypothetical protein A1O3_01985 [Capronia epimyces CBS 606.96]|uniref:Aflatoxin regulatory protein domain-containing protein n=1 Tax=Capronia epimyces CBS 606.96 TaxID=1182542 RepID=W9YI51_9EURO|nr:uncharacterized protein A1O3_01985 [Capronia epimyces CBS 606.96]EXJ88921.1 hypothetical protein A1O3_01985 [Capronia epimyces CBS 606.96]
MAGSRSFSVASELSLFPHSGLPTPTLSPPLFARYLSPIQPQTRPPSRQAFTPVDPSKLHPQSYGAPLSQKPHATPDDEETVCIKLLAHLKRHGQDESQHHETQIELLKKSNAAVRRILQNKMLRSDYACQLVLSSIVNHLVCLCERLCGQSRLDADEARNANSQCLQDQLHFEAGPPFANYAIQHQPCSPSDQEMMVALVEDVLYFTSSTGDMLKKKPISGFQTLGRHETFHVELEQRLKRAIALIRS